MTTYTYRDKHALYQQVAEILAHSISEYSSTQEHVVVGVVGGRNISFVYDQLVSTRVDMNKVKLFLLDERNVPLNHKDSNGGIVQKHLIDTGFLSKENFYPVPVDQQNPLLITKLYEEELKAFGGKFDIVLLSSGEDGHIASLFPHHASIYDCDYGYMYMHDSPKKPYERFSVTKKLLLSAKTTLTLFVDKQKAYECFCKENFVVEECPVKLVKEINDSYVFVLDE